MAATLALVIAIAVVIAIVLGTHSPAAPGANSSHDQASGATTVQRRDLVETDTESGTLSYADPETVYNRLSGTITWLPGRRPGDQARPGALRRGRPAGDPDERDHAGLPGPELL